MVDKILNDRISSRLNELHSFGDKLKEFNKETFTIASELGEGKSEDKAQIINFKKLNIQMNLIEQSMSSILLRLVELYSVAKLSDISLSISDQDKEYIENIMTNRSVDLFGIDKGELIILDKKYHDFVMERNNDISDDEIKDILQYIKSDEFKLRGKELHK